MRGAMASVTRLAAAEIPPDVDPAMHGDKGSRDQVLSLVFRLVMLICGGLGLASAASAGYWWRAGVPESSRNARDSDAGLAGGWKPQQALPSRPSSAAKGECLPPLPACAGKVDRLAVGNRSDPCREADLRRLQRAKRLPPLPSLRSRFELAATRLPGYPEALPFLGRGRFHSARSLPAA